MSEKAVPLVVCMHNLNGEEVLLRVDPEDDFQTFLSKSKSVLGFDVNLNSIVKNQPVNLNDSIYDFLTSPEQDTSGLAIKNIDQIKSDNANDLIYILDDGTQIKASQIHFDNEDPIIDLTNEKIPFIKYTEDDNEAEDAISISDEVKKINITDSPVSQWSSKTSSPKCSFVNSLPFKLVCNNTSVFEAQFTKYLESSTPKTYTNPKSISNIKSPEATPQAHYKNQDDKPKDDDFTGYTREDILNMFKDSPVASLSCGSHFTSKRKHARKTDPSKTGSKYWNSKTLNYDEGILIGGFESQNCFICDKFVNNNLKLYLFDNEDQRLHRSSPQKRSSRQLKIICEYCLDENFKPCPMKESKQSLSPDEYLVIRNNQQYIFKKTKNIDLKLKQVDNHAVSIEVDLTKEKDNNDKIEFVNVEIGSDGEIVTKPIDNDPRSSDDVIVVKDNARESSSDVDIVEVPVIDDNIVDNFDEADEEIKIFLGKYECKSPTSTILKCRFCEKLFAEVKEAMDHVEEHKHTWEEGVVYPCPICDYGYANSKWLIAHLKAAHAKTAEEQDDQVAGKQSDLKTVSPKGSPVAKRTRSSAKKTEGSSEDTPEKAVDEKKSHSNGEKTAPRLVFETEVKQEVVGSSEDEIWIVQNGDATDEQLERLLTTAQLSKDAECSTKQVHRCVTCTNLFPSAECLKSHKCQRRGRKRKTTSKEDTTPACDPKKELKKVCNPKSRRRKNKEASSDPQIVTCHNCNESFTSKVRLKFHMQFHEPTNMMTESGDYSCEDCDLTFSTETELFDHVHFRHDKLKRWQCHVKGCGKTFHLKATLTKHSRSHTDTRRYVCVTCGKRFLDKQTLDEHGVTHLQIKPFQCHICLKQLTRRSRLRMHLRAHEEELTPKLVHVCVVCSRAFRDQEEAQEHASKSSDCVETSTKKVKLEHEEVSISPTGDAVCESVKIAEPNLSKPLPKEVSPSIAEPLLSALGDEARAIIRVVEIEKVFRCEFCEDVFHLENGLNTHRKVHKNVKNPFTCHICKVSFATYSRCTTHKTTHGFYKRPLADAKNQSEMVAEAGPTSRGILGYGGFPVVKHFLCEDCGRSYLHWTYMQVHRRMKHINDHCLYKCNVCEEIFQNSWSLAYHKKKSHSEASESGASYRIPKQDYRIPCRDCDEILPNKNALYKHRKKEHSDMSLPMSDRTDKPLCSICDKPHCSESGRDDLNECHKHPQAQCRRRSLICPVCGLSFGSAFVRDDHMRTHTGARPFPCDLCGLAFKRATAMRNHRVIHTGVRAWSCSRCPKRFRIRSDLRTHVRLKHPAHLAVIEIKGLNPSPDEVRQQLTANNIACEKIIEISKMSFVKGTSSIIPSSLRALAMLGNVARTPVTYSKPEIIKNVFSLAQHCPDMPKTYCRPKILQRSDSTLVQQPTPLSFNMSFGNVYGGADVETITRDESLLKEHNKPQTQFNNNAELK